VGIPHNQLATTLQSGFEINVALDASADTRDLRVGVQDKTTRALGSVRLTLKGK